MSFSTRTITQESEIIQDTVTDTNLDNEGDAFSATLNNKTLGKLTRWISGLSKLIGEAGRRKGATFFTGDNITLTGQITSVGTTVTGSSTLFTTELAVGDLISGTANEYREVQAIASNTSLTLVTAFSSDIGAGQAVKRRQFLAERLDTFAKYKGLIDGRLTFNTVALPPKISSGTYEINGKELSLTSEQTFALSETFLQSRQILDTYCNYLVCLDKTGLKKYVLYGEGAVSGATGTITSITGAGTTKTITAATGTVGAHTDKILVITGNDGVNGVFKITGGNGTTTYTFESQVTITGGATGTWTVYDRINTLHGTGSATAITTDGEVIKYSPSYGENGWSAGIAAWSDSLQGYYLTISGLTGYRVIGNFRTDGSGNILKNVISHKSARNKNDNHFWVNDQPSGYGGTDTSIVRWDFTKLRKIFGCDYTALDSAANATRIQCNRAGFATASHNYDTSGFTGNLGFSLDSAQLTTAPSSVTDNSMLAMIQLAVGYSDPVAVSFQMDKDSILRCHGDNSHAIGSSGGFNGIASYVFNLVL